MANYVKYLRTCQSLIIPSDRELNRLVWSRIVCVLVVCLMHHQSFHFITLRRKKNYEEWGNWGLRTGQPLCEGPQADYLQ